jgi:aminopeptidase
MKDERLTRLAHLMLHHSLDVQPGALFQIDASVTAKPLVKALLEEAARIGAFATVKLEDEEIRRLLADRLAPQDGGASESFLKTVSDWEKRRWEDLSANLAIRAPENDRELSDVDPAKTRMMAAGSREVQDIIVNARRWLLFYWPTRGQAQKAGMSYDRFFDYVMDVCTIDYAKLHEAEKKLASLMEDADRVEIRGPGTDLSFSIQGIPVVCSHGLRNLPDGEVYTAPVRDSVQGTVTYNVPSNYWGRDFSDVRFRFEGGRIVEASCTGDSEMLNRILDADEGARYIGEFSFGVNPLILEPIGSTLFDEKIAGSFHLTPGAAYERAYNGNRSSIHWDLVSIQRPEHGGGDILLDGQLVRRDGRFVADGLEGLNPEVFLGAIR